MQQAGRKWLSTKIRRGLKMGDLAGIRLKIKASRIIFKFLRNYNKNIVFSAKLQNILQKEQNKDHRLENFRGARVFKMGRLG